MNSTISNQKNVDHNIVDIYPLSPMQKEILYFCISNNDPTAYFEQLSMRIQGEFHADAFIKSIEIISSRHDIFRTVFVYTKVTEPKQVVLRNIVIPTSVEDISQRDQEQQNVIIEEFKERDRSLGFDFTQGPLMRLKIYQLSKETFHIVWSYHHILGDGWTFGALLKELLSDIYTRLIKELPPLIACQPVQFSAYIKWLTKQNKQHTLDYWKERLKGFSQLTPVCIQGIKNNPGNIYKMKEKTVSVNTKASSDLKKLAKDNSVTMNILFQTIWGILLSRYNNCNDVVFGSVVAGRPSEISGIESVLGLFINTIPIRIKYKDDDNFEQLLKHCQEQFLEDESRAFLPLSEIASVSETGGKIIDHIIIFENYPFMQEITDNSFINSAGFKIEQMEMHEKTNIDLNIIVYPNKELTIRYNYNYNVYSDFAIELIHKQLISLILEVIANPKVKIGDLNISNKEEIESAYSKLNDTSLNYDSSSSLIDIFLDQVNKGPSNIAVICNGKKLTYSELNEEASNIANFLCNYCDIDLEDRVGILIERSEKMIAAQIGVIKSGGCYVPLDPEWPYERILSIVRDSKIKVMLTGKKHVETCNNLQWETDLKTYLCIDSMDLVSEAQSRKNKLMNLEIWEYYARNEADEIESGGWINSFNGKPFSKEEMKEFTDNVIKKISPYLNSSSRVLEIGCGSALTTFAVSPYVDSILAVDMSPKVLERNKAQAEKLNIKNVTFMCCYADQVDLVANGKFDIIILNSVVQYFPGHNYLKALINKLLYLSNENTIIFFGDLMDQDLKFELISSTLNYKKKSAESVTKTDWRNELFISRLFLEDICIDYPKLELIHIGGKIHSIENELTKYRYDAIFKVKSVSKKKDGKKHRHQFDRRVFEEIKERKNPNTPNGKNLAYVIYTSGSTGKPKGVMIEQRAVHNFIIGMKKRIPFAEGCKILCVTTIAFDIYVLETILPLSLGMTIIVADGNEQNNATAILNLIDKHDIEFIQSTPSRYQLLLLEAEKNLKALDKINVLMVGGEAVTPILVEKLKKLTRAQIWNMYGPTETTIWSTIARLDTNSTVHIGTPIANTKCMILDRNKNIVPPGVIGELWIGGDGLARGYMNLDSLTQMKFNSIPSVKNQRFYNTGDLAYLHTDGHIEFIGRIDNQIKLRGFRIELDEIEEIISKYESIDSVTVLALPGPDDENCLKAFYTLKPGYKSDGLRDYCQTCLPSYMIPAFWVELEKMPLNTNGKIDRKKLSVFNYSNNDNKNGCLPETEKEKYLAKIWADLFKRKIVFTDDNFFEIGGHSLLAMAMIARIQRETGITISVNDVFEKPSVSLLADLIEKRSENINKIVLSKAEPKKYYEMSSAQLRIFILYELEGPNCVYNLPWAGLVDGKMEVERFRKAVSLLQKRFVELRTTFSIDNDIPMQVLNSSPEIEVEYFIEDSEKEINKESVSRLLGRFIKPFDLRKGPLVRIRLHRISESRHLILFDIHHIIADATSMKIIIEDLVKLYRGDELPTPEFQYIDYSEWLIKNRHGDKSYQKSKKYWIEKLSEEIPILLLPYDYPRLSQMKFHGSSIDFKIDNETVKKINKLARECEVTPTVMYLSIFSVLLYRYSQQSQFVIGVPAQGRQVEETHHMVGMFVNMLPIKINISEKLNIAEFLIKMRKSVADAFIHQDYPFEEMVESLKIKRDLGHNPLFDVMLTVQPVEKVIKMEDLTIHPIEQTSKISKFDLSAYILLKGESVTIRLEYSTSLFKKETINQMGHNLIKLCSVFAQNASTPIRDVKIHLKKKNLQCRTLLNQSKPYSAYTEDSIQNNQKKMLEFWIKKLNSAPSCINLITDHARTIQPSIKKLTVTFKINSDLLIKINELIISTESTIFVTLLCAWASLLKRYCNENDIVIGAHVKNLVPQKNTNCSSPEKLIPLRIDLRNNPSFCQMIERIQKTCFEAYDNRDVSIETLIKELYSKSDLVHSPLFQVVLMLENNQKTDKNHPGMSSKPEITSEKNYELIMKMSESDGEITGSIEFADNLFDKSTIERMARQYLKMLHSAVDNPDKTINKLDIIPDDEMHKMLIEWNDNKQVIPQKCIHQLFEEQVSKNPFSRALIFKKEILTFNELNNRANQLAHLLVEMGVRPETLVAIALERSTDLIVAMLAVFKAGGAYIPLDLAYPSERLSFMLSDSGTKIMITHEKNLENLPKFKGYILCLDKEIDKIVKQPYSNLQISVKPSNLAYVIYTSGSTGKPKGVALEHRNTVAFLSWAKTVWTKEEAAGVLAGTSICFDLSIFEIIFPLSIGTTIILVNDILAIGDMECRNEVTLINTVPSAIDTILRQKLLPSNIKVVNTGGEPLTTKLADRIYVAGNVQRVFDLYGPTEDTTYSTVKLRAIGEKALIGRPIANTKIYVLDNELQPTPIGIPGELYIGGAGLARGYLNRPELTAEKFIENHFSDQPGSRLYKTGDLVRYHADGNIEFLGRMDNQVKIRGFRIELGEIEAALLNCSGIKDCVVVARGEELDSKKIIAYLVCEKEKDQSGDLSQNTSAKLKLILKKTLPEYMIPADIVFLSELPLTPNGKVDRKALPEPKEENLQHQIVAPSDELEWILWNVWTYMLKRKNIGIHDNFFEVGGNSLMAVKVVSRINDSYNISASIRLLFENPTIVQLANRIRRIISETSQKIDKKITNIIREDWQLESRICNLKVGEENRSVLFVITKDKKDVRIDELLLQCYNLIGNKGLVDHCFQVESFETDSPLNANFLSTFRQEFDTNLAESIESIGKYYLSADLKLSQMAEDLIEEHIIPATALQTLQYNQKQRFGGTIFLFDNIPSVQRLKNACHQIIKEQSLLRSIPFLNGETVEFKVYPIELIDDIPVLNVSEYVPEIQRVAGTNICQKVFRLEEKGDEVSRHRQLFRWCIMQITRKKYLLVCGFDHIIYDGFSGEIIRSRIEELCRCSDMPSIKSVSYAQYVNLLKMGPDNLSDRDITERLKLVEFSEAEKKFQKVIRTIPSGSQYERFNIKRDPYVIEEDILVRTLLSTCRIIESVAKLKVVPVRLITNARIYGNQTFFETVGEFLDILPLPVIASENEYNLKTQIQQSLEFCRKNCINCLTLSNEKQISKKFPESSSYLKSIIPSERLLWFNFHGKSNGPSNLVKRLLPLEKISGAAKKGDLFVEVSYDDKNINFFVGSNFNFGVDSIQDIFRKQMSMFEKAKR